MNKHKMKHHRKSDTKTANRDHIRTNALEQKPNSALDVLTIPSKTRHWRTAKDTREFTNITNGLNRTVEKYYMMQVIRRNQSDTSIHYLLKPIILR